MAFETLRESPLWNRIAHLERWCATMPGKPKIPVDMGSWGDFRLRGNRHGDATDCWGLPELLDAVPAGSPVAFRLDVAEAGVLVADIEPGCDPSVVDALMAAPWLYGEASLSGRGLHLVFDADDLAQHLDVDAERVRSANGDHEYLQKHWVTFTGKAVDPSARGTDVSALVADYASCPEHLSGKRRDPTAEDLARFRARAARTHEGDAQSLTEWLELLSERRQEIPDADRSSWEYRRMRWLLHRATESREAPSCSRGEMLAVCADVARRTFPEAELREIKKGRRRGMEWYDYLAETAAQGIL